MLNENKKKKIYNGIIFNDWEIIFIYIDIFIVENDVSVRGFWWGRKLEC